MPFYPQALNQAITLSKAHPNRFSMEILGHEVSLKKLPIIAFSTGCSDAKAPMLILSAGVNGHSTVEADFIVGWMHALCAKNLDPAISTLLTPIRVVFIPAVNPWGLSKRSRYNSQGVEIARNAPIDAQGSTTLFFGGHRVAPWLPGFRGKREHPMQLETQTLVDFVISQSALRRCVIAVDCETRLSTVDRLGFPFSHTSEPMPWLPLMMRFKTFLSKHIPDRGMPMHPQWTQGLKHGSIWDYVLEQAPLFNIAEGQLVLVNLMLGRLFRRTARPASTLLSCPDAPTFHSRALLAHVLMTAAATSSVWTDIDPSERASLLGAGLDGWWGKRI